MNLGIIPGEPFADYLRSGAIGHTRLTDYIESKRGYYLRYVLGLADAAFKGTDATDLGSAGHTYRNEGARVYRDRYAIQPATYTSIAEKGKLKGIPVTKKWNARAKVCEAWEDEQEAAGKHVLSHAIDRKARLCALSIRRNAFARKLLQGAQGEVSMRCIHRASGMPLQCRVDVYKPGEYAADLKFTAAGPRGFQGSVIDNGLDIQDALYGVIIYGLTQTIMPFYFIVQQTVYPFDCDVIELPEHIVDMAWQKAEKALEGIQLRDWGQPQTEARMQEFAQWAERKLEVVA